MKGFYVYCVRFRGAGASRKKSKGIDFGGPAYPIAFRDIEAIVSEVDISKFDAKSIKDKLENDAKWTKKNIKGHHETVAWAGKSEAVVPMKFGMLFKTKKSLEDILKKYYRKFKNLIIRLKDKQEWGVKGYLEYKKFVELLKKKNKEIKELEEKRSQISEGMRWYVDRKSDEIISNKIEREIENHLQKIAKELEKQTEKLCLNNLLPKELGEPDKDMILNAACLVRNDALGKFRSLFQKLEKEYGVVGIILTMTGPWPPYNFVKINEKT